MHSFVAKRILCYPPRGVQSSFRRTGVRTATLRCRDPPCGGLHKTLTPQRSAAASKRIKALKPCKSWMVAAGESSGVDTTKCAV